MRHSTAGRLLGTVFLAFAVSLLAYGLYGLSRFAWYTGACFDDRLVLFDNGVYPFLWGCLFLLLGQCLRLRISPSPAIHGRCSCRGVAAPLVDALHGS